MSYYLHIRQTKLRRLARDMIRKHISLHHQRNVRIRLPQFAWYHQLHENIIMEERISRLLTGIRSRSVQALLFFGEQDELNVGVELHSGPPDRACDGEDRRRP